MEFESREVKWYWLFLFVLYCGCVVYLLFNGNPYLYSHYELRSALKEEDTSELRLIPTKPESMAVTAPTYFERYNFERTSVDPLGTPRYRDYQEYKSFPVDLGPNANVQHIAQDATGFYLTGRSPMVWHVGLEGEVIWQFKVRALPPEKSLLPVMLDEQSAYVVHPQGEILCLNKADGSIRWLLQLDEDVLAKPFLWDKHIAIPIKNGKGLSIALVQRANGRLVKQSDRLDIKPNFEVSYSANGKFLIATYDNKVAALDPTNFRIVWTQTLTEPIKGPALALDNSLYLVTMGGKVMKLDASKRGKMVWETDTDRAAVSAPSYLPVVNRLSLLDNNGNLMTLDAKNGKILWTYPAENRSPLLDSWSVRLSAKHIEEFQMDWLHKGWTIWAPCGTSRFCIFTPNKGQLIQRVSLSVAPLTLPLQVERRWVFFGQKGDKYMLSHIAEGKEIRKMQAEKDEKAAVY